jgi:cob(I)alamin adenosyltransferase
MLDPTLTLFSLMADATKEFMELEKLEQDVQLRRHQVQTSAFTTLPSDIRTTFQTGLANAESAYEKKKDSYNSIINRLSETTFWPAVPSQRVGELETKLKEAKTMLGGLADGVGQLYKKIEGLYEERGGGTTAKRSGMNEDLAAGSGDGAVHTKKRRRLSINGSDDATPSDIRENVESIKSTIREIEDHLHEVENDISQHSCHIMELLEVKIEEKIEDIARNTDISSLVEVRLGPQTVKTIQAFSESFAHADREIGELAQEVAELIPKLDSLKHDNDLFKQEEAANKELLAEVRALRFCCSHTLTDEDVCS